MRYLNTLNRRNFLRLSSMAASALLLEAIRPVSAKEVAVETIQSNVQEPEQVLSEKYLDLIDESKQDVRNLFYSKELSKRDFVIGKSALVFDVASNTIVDELGIDSNTSIKLFSKPSKKDLWSKINLTDAQPAKSLKIPMQYTGTKPESDGKVFAVNFCSNPEKRGCLLLELEKKLSSKKVSWRSIDKESPLNFEMVIETLVKNKSDQGSWESIKYAIFVVKKG